MARNLRRHDPRSIPKVAAAIIGGIAVRNLFVPAEFGHAEPVSGTWHRGEIARNDQIIVGVLGPADIAERAVLVVVAIDPLETGGVEVDLVLQGKYHQPRIVL